ncbi:hypothetical protein BU17DRAFT_77359 [Hysterangium stoloniferum]|nr:hypothetical protein BU17DRAFT_77359 [Hysterangium stoloniferum]
MSFENKPAERMRGANRSSKAAGKLKVLPEQPDQPALSGPKTAQLIDDSDVPDVPKSQRRTESSDDEEEDESEELQDQEDVEVYNQIAQIPEGTARKDALRLTKKKAKSLPRVTAYCTAGSYRMDDLLKFFHARKSAYRTAVRRFDEVIYTPYTYDLKSQTRNGSVEDAIYDPAGSTDRVLPSLPGMNEATVDLELASPVETRDPGMKPRAKRFQNQQPEGEADVFLFEYGTVVMWGMTEAQEKRFLSSIRRFEVEKLPSDSVEKEDLNFYYADYSRIYNDVITLRKGSSYMTKLSLSHALSQSVKISLFEELISNTIEQTKDIPGIISETGKIKMKHNDIMRQIGQLFMLRININLVGSVLDAPEIFWSFPDLQPLYDAARSYLEIPQRTRVLNDRVEVLQDMLQLLKESAASRHAERLEQIVIVLIAIEIVIGITTIVVDLYA